jgi:hypothetical protein
VVAERGLLSWWLRRELDSWWLRSELCERLETTREKSSGPAVENLWFRAVTVGGA